MISAARAIAAEAPIEAPQKVAVTAEVAATHDELLRLAEEQLQVGKGMVETGATGFALHHRARGNGRCHLHEERAEVLRRAISAPTRINDLGLVQRGSRHFYDAGSLPYPIQLSRGLGACACKRPLNSDNDH